MTRKVLNFDKTLFEKMQRAFDESPYKSQVGEYWANYVASIVSVINKSQLAGFGDNYHLTQGFGDSLKYHAPRYRLRKMIPIPFIYRALEKRIVIFNHRKKADTLFSDNKQALPATGQFAVYLAEDLDRDVRELEVSRYFRIGEHRAPWRYWMFLIYLEMLLELCKVNQLDGTSILSGNYLDIGGGYGSSLDGIALFKKFRKIGDGTVNYDVDQFPVTYIANQYLERRNLKGTLPPIVDDGDLPTAHPDPKGDSHSYFRVIQNNVVDSISALNVSLFFNSNSFQEMDVEQVEAYCRFMQRNKAQKAYLGAYFYDSVKASNSPQRSLDVLSRYFKLVGTVNMEKFFQSRGLPMPTGWVVKGNYYLFDLG